jgi:CHAT domain-containing protein
VAALGRTYPDAITIASPSATVAKVAGALDGAAMAHVAAHGNFRADNPLFSSLRLADGPLTVYDLECLSRAPTRMVLSACEVGLSAARAGGELMGLSAALLSLGTAALVASVVAVPDAATRGLMLAFHRRVARGAAFAEALAGAQAEMSRGGRYAPATAGFVCFGAA